MSKLSLLAAGAIIVLANAFALVHAARNRMGTPEAELTFSDKEAAFFGHYAFDDDSGESLSLMWTGPNLFDSLGHPQPDRDFIDRNVLQQLGFDCSVDPTTAPAGDFYQRQRSRQAFVALAYESPGHLVALDADRNVGKLRERHPDRNHVVILPAVIAIRLIDRSIVGWIQQIPSSIHVPRPFSEFFRNIDRNKIRAGKQNYKVHIRFGSLLEPWVTGVEPNAATDH